MFVRARDNEYPILRILVYPDRCYTTGDSGDLFDQFGTDAMRLKIGKGSVGKRVIPFDDATTARAAVAALESEP